ncbi:sigma-70 family RNA polymerase sigma factor [Vitiosangium sp. GDMCC 1.1324]|uniref:sigma-70 family RNA polymerase sigma factor n=1 Tax=Vitiosangium sp. (strain GDMCC 1.1324) TaxID=2138576 RepID=UPI000D33F0C7|nr:sigma-70 family RNA polymerase sigma factor [Vitiosangium sp. GDMCC 1.1324]PTL80515.1 RNA polymerase subunit sigma-70 [Vitiosangium sp. GDMCC 1.1324]
MGLGEDKKVLLEKYGPYVRSLASTVRRQFSAQLELDELIAYGQIGLLEAADRFDPKVGANFLTFAHYRIKGAIYDGLRKMGVLKGGDARSAYMGERATAYLGNLSDREQGGGNRGGSIDDDVMEISNAVAGLAMVFATSLEGADSLGFSDESLPVDQRLELEQQRVRVRAAIEKLPEKERRLLQGYYFQGKTLEEAGSEIGQSKSWASRLHARAIERLKELLNEEESSSPADSRRQSHGGSDGRRLGGADRPAEVAGSGRAAGQQAGGLEVRRGSR